MELFGLSIVKRKAADNASAAISTPVEEDGASIITTSSAAAYYGFYMDLDGLARNEIAAIQKYREISLYPEIDIAIQDIVNEAVPQEDDTPQVEIDLDELEFSDVLKDKIRTSFEEVISMLKYNKLSSDIFRRWYIDGRLFYQIIVDKDNLKKGILELRLIEASKIRKVKEVVKEKSPSGVDIVKEINEYFVYSENGFGASSAQNQSQGSSQQVTGVKLSPDTVVFVPSGAFDSNSGQVLSYLHKAIRPANQLRMLEDATVVYLIARAPERRVFYVDVGGLPKLKAEQYLKDIMNRYRNKMVYDAKSGEVRDDKKYMSMLEDFWMPRRDGGKGTEIQTLPGVQNAQQYTLNLEYFQKKVYQALNVPVSRLIPETGFNLGHGAEISRDELKFQKFIDRLRRKFSELFYDALRTQLVLKGICNNAEWEDIKEKIHFKFQKDNFFSEFKEQELLQGRISLIPQVDQYLGKYFSKQWVQKNVLRMSDDDIERMNEEISEEKSDPTAQPTMQGMDPSMMGGDPSMQGGFGDGQDGQQDQDQFPFQGDDQSQEYQ